MGTEELDGWESECKLFDEMERVNCSSTAATPRCNPITSVGISCIGVNCVNADDSNWFFGFLLFNYPEMSFVDRVINKAESMFAFIRTWNEGPTLNFTVLTSLGDPLCISEQRFSDLESCHIEILFDHLY